LAARFFCGAASLPRHWRAPGNVRELENTIHRAILLSTSAEIGVDGILTPDGARLDQALGACGLCGEGRRRAAAKSAARYSLPTAFQGRSALLSR
jgi:DNA-binding NtrC family response regulator